MMEQRSEATAAFRAGIGLAWERVAFVASLIAAVAVLFSAAVPHQGGWNHLNEQWPQYWAEIFARRRFFPVDCLRERFWNRPNVRWWYAQAKS